MMEISKEEYEAKAKPVFDRLIAPVEAALKEANMDKEEINEIVLVGGSSRTPWIQNWLKQFFETDRLMDKINLDESVAVGATMMAGQLMGQIAEEDD